MMANVDSLWFMNEALLSQKRMAVLKAAFPGRGGQFLWRKNILARSAEDSGAVIFALCNLISMLTNAKTENARMSMKVFAASAFIRVVGPGRGNEALDRFNDFESMGKSLWTLF